MVDERLVRGAWPRELFRAVEHLELDPQATRIQSSTYDDTIETLWRQSRHAPDMGP
jgi:hypothetical protein